MKKDFYISVYVNLRRSVLAFLLLFLTFQASFAQLDCNNAHQNVGVTGTATQLVLGREDANSSIKIEVYPNPTSAEIFIR